MPTEAHRAFMEDLKGTLAKNVNLSAAEMLAISAQFVGMLVAAQDQAKYTPEAAMQMVASNIEIGNKQAIEGLLSSQGRA